MIAAAATTTALVFYKDFKDLEVPDWIVDVCGVPIIAFWIRVLCPDLQVFRVLSAVWVLLLAYSLTRLSLTAVGWLFGVGSGDATYASVLVLLLPSPALWGSPFPHVPSGLGAMPLDFVANVTLVFAIGGIAVKVYVRLRKKSVAIPFTPAVAATFGATVLLGAWWRPVLMPAIKLVAEVLGAFL